MAKACAVELLKLTQAEQLELFEPEPLTLQPRRLDWGMPERVYFALWKSINRRSYSRNRGYTALEWILCPDGQEYPGPVTQRDHVVAACVIQWLGTTVGGGFLRRCEELIEELNVHKREETTKNRRAVFGVPMTYYPPEKPTRRIEL